MKISLRPPTKRMIEKLKECLEKESNNNEKIPCLPEEMKSSLAGLYKRRLIDTRMEIVNNKKQLCIYVTESGKKFLSDLETSSNK
jgi:Txe/YoeB family toxin of Txe-Axe toxin-antitoxin module